MDADLPYFVAFSMFPGIGPVRFQLLYDYFSSAKNAWSASAGELAHIGLGEKLIERFCAFRKTIIIESLLPMLEKAKVTALPFYDKRYPMLLSEVSDRPFVLYVKGYRGKLPINLSDTVAVVGTRKVTRYGAQVTEAIAGDLAKSGVTVISGMAYGVDAVAHKAALDSGGATIAVLGCGVDVIAPVSNTRLYRDIIESGRGAVVSEMPLGMRPDKGLFPARNRIISGLSRAVVVTEGTEQSGSLITARYAAEQGRDVFAVPGSITNPYSKGPSKLIRDGATLITSAGDILEHFDWKNRGLRMKTDGYSLSVDEQKVRECLSRGTLSVDAIVRESGLTASRVAGILTVFEMRQIARDIGEKTYSLIT